jgi:succinate-semialdehyde dehydrogenase/glutarate-semialdehyde dehydrogenase
MTMPLYPEVLLLIGGRWRPATSGETLEVENPATGKSIGRVACAATADLDAAVAAADAGFAAWRGIPAFDRYKTMRQAADLLRERVDAIAPVLTLEQGKPLGQARAEVLSSADLIDWFAEEARRTYGRIIPSRAVTTHQLAFREPVGPVAAFTPWNFPMAQIVRKVGGALAAGCSIIVKGPEETPASPAELIRAFVDAGVPPGTVNLVFGDPAAISAQLVPHPVIRKISFTGSTAVGKRLAALAGQHMKRTTMELGGHAPVVVFGDADLDLAVSILAATKVRNAGQVCTSPTRFLVDEAVYRPFVDRLCEAMRKVVVGDGLDPQTGMGPLVHGRRLAAVESLVADALAQGATLETGGQRIGNKGYFYAPTVLSDVPVSARVMIEEPFGPVAMVRPFASYTDMLAEANRLPVGLAAYAFTRSADLAARIAAEIETGQIAINHVGLGVPEVPFGGVKDSGYGSEGGTEAMEAYLNTKFVSHAHP